MFEIIEAPWVYLLVKSAIEDDAVLSELVKSIEGYEVYTDVMLIKMHERHPCPKHARPIGDMIKSRIESSDVLVFICDTLTKNMSFELGSNQKGLIYYVGPVIEFPEMDENIQIFDKWVDLQERLKEIQVDFAERITKAER